MDEGLQTGQPSPRSAVLLATSTPGSRPHAESVSRRENPTRTGVESTSWRWEADMTGPVVDQVTRLLPRTRVAHLVVGEVPAAVGIVDVVAVSFRRDAVRHRLHSGVGPLCSPLRIRTLDVLQNGRPQRVTTVASKVGSNPAALRKSTLSPLADLGLVELSEKSVMTTGAWCPVAAQLTAVELKLSKWRDALRQADNFALSADRSWVVLDESRGRRAVAAAETFEAFGVGLATLDEDGRLRVVIRPRGRRPERWLRALMAERAWAVAEAEVAAIASV
jgi:hypothetical protein